MGEETSVKVLGYWSSAYTMRVELALKLKGIPYEYSDEDLHNKSELLLESNPVHKKVPVLIHNGKPIAESLIIVEYIDEAWSTSAPKLLPEDPYKRAQSRFWTSFVHQQLFDSMLPIALTEGEAQEKALKAFHDNLKVVEDGARDLVARGSFADINEKNLGLLDVVLHSVLGPYRSFEEALGLKLIDQEKFPLIFSLMKALNELPTISQLILQTHDERVSHLKHFRQMALKKPSS